MKSAVRYYSFITVRKPKGFETFLFRKPCVTFHYFETLGVAVLTDYMTECLVTKLEFKKCVICQFFEEK